MNLDERVNGLLRLVEDYRDAECRTLLAAARAEAGEILARAYGRERQRLHERVAAERAAARGRIQAARAERDTRLRGGAERANARLLALAWPRLGPALIERWQDPQCRRAWALGALGQARRALPPGPWTVRHAPGWPDGERQSPVDELDLGPEAEPDFLEDPALAAGLIVECRGAALDASLGGLLADRSRIESRLLALLGATPAVPPVVPPVDPLAGGGAEP
jgi:hypothetical protein